MSDGSGFHEATAEPRVESVPLAHLSIELGHLYMEDFAAGEDVLHQHFHRIAPWVNAARQSCVDELGGRTARISSCFLVDDYFTRFSSPRELVPRLVRAAQAAGLRIDYLARESGCAQTDGVRLAELVRARLVAEPPPGSNGARPPSTDSGWICNGQRSPTADTGEAMVPARPWQPPVQNAANRHSIFLDVEMWDQHGGHHTWSCPFLAAVWQLLRLGLLRDNGRRVGQPCRWNGEFPDDWDDLPGVVQLHPQAQSFSAYRTVSILSARFLPVEHAVRTILGQVAVDHQVTHQVAERGAAEGLDLPMEPVDRIEYVFAGPSVVRR